MSAARDRAKPPRDPRISRYRKIAQEMRRGRFRVDLPVYGDDELGRLGRSLVELGDWLEQRFQEMEQLNRLAEEMHRAVLLDEALDFIYTSFRTVIPYDRLGCALVRREGEELFAESVWARSEAEDLSIPAGYRAPLAGSSLLDVLESGRPRILNDLETYLADHPDSDPTLRIVAEGVRSSLTCPLVALGSPVGFLFFSSRQLSTYEDAHVEVFLRIAGHVSTIVEKSRLYQELLDTKAALEEANQRLRWLADVDGLTEIPNRRSFDVQLEIAWRTAIRRGASVALLLADIDHFKEFNDSRGHLEGDEALKRVARTFRDQLPRSGDFAARYGGEELAVILPDTLASGAARVAERLRAAVEALGISGDPGGGPPLTVSIGAAACVPALGENPETLISRADRALYAAKGRGRNQCVVDDPAELSSNGAPQ